MIQLPARLPGLRMLIVVVAIAGVVWISLEGRLWQVVALAAALTVASSGILWERYAAGRRLTVHRWYVAATLGGLLLGATCLGLALALMAVKTGLHAHGPEFRLAEIHWVLRQWAAWPAAGALLGAGIGLIVVATGRYHVAEY